MDAGALFVRECHKRRHGENRVVFFLEDIGRKPIKCDRVDRANWWRVCQPDTRHCGVNSRRGKCSLHSSRLGFGFIGNHCHG